MNIQITSRKFKAKESLKDYIYSELDSLEKLYDDILDVDVILSYENIINSSKTAEIILQVPGKVLTSTEKTDDFRKSVSAAVDKLEKQLTRMKTKRIDTKRVEKIK